MVIQHIKKLTSRVFGQKHEPVEGSDVIEIGMKKIEDASKVSLQMATLEKFGDTENILQLLRNGDKILLVKISILREKDMTELKRSINRIKTHCAATGGDMAAIDDNWIVIVPPVVGIERK